MDEDKVRVKVVDNNVGIKFPDFRDDDGFHWLTLDEVWDFQAELAIAVREAWINHEEKRVEETLALTDMPFEEEAG